MGNDNLQWLADIIGTLPFAEVMWTGGDGMVLTVMARIHPQHEPQFEKLAFAWMERVPNSTFMVAKQLLDWQGRKGYLWNISLFSSDFDSALRTMSSVTGAPAPPQAQPDQGPYVPPHMQKRMGIEGETVEQRDSRGKRTMQVDAYSPERVHAEKREGGYKMFTVPLKTRGMRNIPRPGSTKGTHSWSGKRPGT